MNEIFIVAFTGGYEEPQFAAFRTRDEANRQFDEWLTEAALASGDNLAILRINLTTMTIDYEAMK